MSPDFTLEKYRELCQALTNSHYVLLTVADYLESPNLPQKFAILRHDIDTRPWKAMRIAEIEKIFGIRSTYYFRFNQEVFQPYFIKELANLGHEIGYHYETLDNAKGDYKKAIELFEYELNEFRKIIDIKTICMHGNPLTKWDNRHLWNKYDFTQYNLVGEAYLSIDFKDLQYFSDSGRNWGNGGKVKDTVISGSVNQQSVGRRVNSTDKLIKLLVKEELAHIYLLSHPGVWSDNFYSWTGELIKNMTINLVKRLIKLKYSNR